MSHMVIFALILACLAAFADSFGLRPVADQCPLDAELKLHECLTELERIGAMDLDIADHCRSAGEAMRCARMVVLSCMESYDILKVLSIHDKFSVSVDKIRPVCFGS